MGMRPLPNMAGGGRDRALRAAAASSGCWSHVLRTTFDVRRRGVDCATRAAPHDAVTPQPSPTPSPHTELHARAVSTGPLSAESHPRAPH
eukprot:7377846-Prymnesium_polylepis.1